jgi:phosphoketolase
MHIGSGYGYQARIVEDLDHIHDDLAASMDWALSEIKKIQKAAREGKPIIKPRWPVLILRTPKVRFSSLHSAHDNIHRASRRVGLVQRL